MNHRYILRLTEAEVTSRNFLGILPQGCLQEWEPAA